MRRALLVGINDYGTSVSSLKGCVADAWRMFQVLSTHEDGSQNFECKLIANPGTYHDKAISQAKDTDEDSVRLEKRITAGFVKEHLHDRLVKRQTLPYFISRGMAQ